MTYLNVLTFGVGSKGHRTNNTVFLELTDRRRESNFFGCSPPFRDDRHRYWISDVFDGRPDQQLCVMTGSE